MQPTTDEQPASAPDQEAGSTGTASSQPLGDAGFTLDPSGPPPATFTVEPLPGSGPSLAPPPQPNSEPRERAGQTSGSASEAGNEADVAGPGESVVVEEGTQPIASAGAATSDPLTVTPEGGSALGGESNKDESAAADPEYQLPPTEAGAAGSGETNPFGSAGAAQANPVVPNAAAATGLARPGIGPRDRGDPGAINRATDDGSANNGESAAPGGQFGEPGVAPSDFYGPTDGKRRAGAADPGESGAAGTDGPSPLGQRDEASESPTGETNPFGAGSTTDANSLAPGAPGATSSNSRGDSGAINSATGDGPTYGGASAPAEGGWRENLSPRNSPARETGTEGGHQPRNERQYESRNNNTNGAEVSSNGAKAPAQDPGQQGHHSPGSPADPGPGVAAPPRENSAKAPYDPALGAAEQRAREAAAAAAAEEGGGRNALADLRDTAAGLSEEARAAIRDQVDATEEAVRQQAGSTTDGFSQDGRDRWVTMDDWKKLNDRDGDGMVDRNYPPGTGDPGTGAPPGAVGDGVPPPAGNFNGGVGDRLPDGGLSTERTGLLNPRDPGRFNVPGVGTGAEALPDRDGDGRPDFRVDPGNLGNRPGYEAPTKLPGLEVPDNLRPTGPGQRFDPDDNLPPVAHPPADTAPPPVNHGGHEQPPAGQGEYETPTTDRGGHEQPGIGRGGYDQPSAGSGTQQPRVPDGAQDYADPPPPPGNAAESPAATEPPPNSVSPTPAADGNAGLDVFYTDPAAKAAQPAPYPARAPGEPPQAESGPVAGQFQPDAAPATEATHASAEESSELSPEVAAMVETIRRAIWSMGGDSDAVAEDENQGGAAVIERIVQAVRDLIFVSDQDPSDQMVAAQLSQLDPADLAELERYALAQDDGESG